MLAVTGALLLPVVFFYPLYFRSWAPKAALCLVLLPPGLVVLARLVAEGSRPAMLAAAFVGVAAVSTLLSDNVVLSVVGMANWGTGLLFAATLAGAWALGTFAGPARRRQLALAIVAAAVVNAVVAWLQARSLVPPALEDLRTTVAGRTGGLMGNPVHLGALMAGAAWLIGQRLGRERRSRWWAAALVLVAGAAQLSGGRSAVVLAGLAVLACLPGADARRRVLIAGAVAVGVVLAPVGVEGATLGSARAVQTAAAPGPDVVGSTDTRLAIWRISVDAMRERPIVGWGPGRFLAATSHRYDAASGREGGVFTDAHNWVVEYGVTTGVVGLGLLLAWLGAAARGARGPLLGFAVILGIATLVEPLTPALTPLAFMALGASGVRTRGGDGAEADSGAGGRTLNRAWARAASAGLAVGVAAAALLVTGQVLMRLGQSGLSAHRVHQASAVLPPWPDVPALEARLEVLRGLERGEPNEDRVLELARSAVRRDPADPTRWAYLGVVELAWGDVGRAAQAYRRSLDRNPWFAEGLAGSAVVAERQGDEETLAESCRRLRVIDIEQPVCRRGG